MNAKFRLMVIPALPAVIMFCCSWSLHSQQVTQKERLLQLSAEWQKISREKQADAISYARTTGLPVREEKADGTIIDLQFIEDGVPFYYKTENINAAITTRTNLLWPGGSLGLNLDGTGYDALGEWDGGAVRGTHQEFTNTGSTRVTQMDGAGGYADHSTHVAGTMIAGGVVSNARGMGNNGTLKAWEWNSDASEMAAAAADGLQISNHSYGYIRGWYYNGFWIWYGNPNISTQEDYLFGFYNSYSQQWDQIAYNAPYYLIVKSAGNDRLEGPTNGDYPQDGAPDGYDCIGEVGVAKNILTVGAVYDVAEYTGPGSVVMSSFSGWGPADDGRIKPDLVANGISLYSSLATNNSAYGSYSGTSMAAPNTSGTLALLQKHYQNTHSGASMRAATLKGLVIHTADEAGTSTGPDYEFGWGLLNAAAAAQKITEDAAGGNVIDELTLSNGGTYQRQVTSDGSQPLAVTLCWTDPPGTPPAASLDPVAPMLVNDLDIRLTMAGTTYYPWKLNRDNPSAAATNTGENNVDNIEKVFIASPAAGDYTIVIDHDGTLANPQAYSIIISGIATAPPQPPVADFVGNPVTIMAGQSVAFTDLSTNVPTSWAWTFPGGDPATSSSQNPTVTYASAGTYDVTLVATNGAGSDTELKTGYITVSPYTPTYCPSHGNATLEWVASVKIGNVTYPSGGSGPAGYEDFTGNSFPLVIGTPNSITLTPGFSGSKKSECWRVWIDYNQDGDFLDAGELVYSKNKSKVAVTGSFTVPAGTSTGSTRMRVSMKRNSGPAPCEVFASGEVEDYTVNITASLKGTEAIQPAVTATGQDGQDEMILFPNPANDQLHIILGEDLGNATIRIFDFSGRQLLNQEVNGREIVLDTSVFTQGVYILVAESGGTMIQRKFIIGR